MQTSPWHRDTSLLALSLSLDHMLQESHHLRPASLKAAAPLRHKTVTNTPRVRNGNSAGARSNRRFITNAQ